MICENDSSSSIVNPAGCPLLVVGCLPMARRGPPPQFHLLPAPSRAVPAGGAPPPSCRPALSAAVPCMLCSRPAPARGLAEQTGPDLDRRTVMVGAARRHRLTAADTGYRPTDPPRAGAVASGTAPVTSDKVGLRGPAGRGRCYVPADVRLVSARYGRRGCWMTSCCRCAAPHWPCAGGVMELGVMTGCRG